MKEPLTEQQRQAVINERKAGVTVTQLAEKYSVSAPTIYNILRRAPKTTILQVLRAEIESDEAQLAPLEALKANLEKKKAALKLLEGESSK